MKKETNEENRKVNKKRIILFLLFLVVLISVIGITVGTLNSRENNNDTVLTVTFINGNEEISIPQQVTGGKIPKPADPIKESTEEVSYKFDGWYTDAEFTQPFDFEKDTITKETTFYAKFTEIMNKYKVSFYVDNNPYGMPQDVEYGKHATKLEDPTKASTAQFTYTFEGWYTDTELTQPFNFENDTITKETKLYAKFEATTNKYAVLFYANGAQYGVVQNVEYGQKVTAPANPTKESTSQFTYTFVGWYTDTEFTQPFNFGTDTITKETKLYAKFEATTNKYSVSFYVDGELYGVEQSIEYGKSATKPGDPTKASTEQFTYTFEGWYTDAELLHSFNFNNDKITKETKLYAKFEATTNKYSVSFYVDGELYGVEQSIEYGKYATKPGDPTKPNTDQFTYEFVGWYIEAELQHSFNFNNDKITKETKLYAKFEATTNKYSVSFYANGNQYGEAQSIEYGKHATKPGDPTKPNTDQFTYEFVGWYIEAELQHSFNFNNDKITKETKLYAKFEATTNKYSVSFYVDGELYGEPQDVEYGEKVTAPVNPTKESTAQFTYTFEGWYTEAELQHSFNFNNDKITKETKLYAKFEETDLILIYTSTDSGASYSVTGIRQDVSEIRIPYFHEGKPVTSIGDAAFYGCSRLTSITIPNSVTSIGSDAFYECSNLSSIEIPNSVESIGDGAFYECSHLASITILEGVKTIGNSAFEGCSSLTDIKIPDKVTSIGDFAFYGCSNLSSITISTSVTSIGNSAFNNCSSLKSITILGKVTSIGERTFAGCYKLESITIPTSVTSIGNSAFYGCSSLTSITIPEGVKTIGNSVFEGCSRLTSITIPESVTSIGNEAFQDCFNLKSIKIPKDVTIIGNSAFYGCNSLANIIIPEGLITIGDFAFRDCFSLTSIEIPNSVESIGNKAFQSCSSLTDIKIPEGVTKIGNYAFNSCSILKSITIPEGVTSIGERTFAGCYKLESITIPTSVISIGDYAFLNCRALQNVTIPKGVTSIGNFAFQYCTSLTSITFENTVEWYVTTNNTTSGTPVTVSDSSQNATYLKSTYYDYYWYRK